MPITRSAKKALRQAKRRTIRNAARTRTWKTAVKQVRKLIAAKNVADAQKALPSMQQALDKAAKKRALSYRTAARLKSRIAKSLAAAKSASR
ncbi:30S ribosomal protein S20 [Candidatus Parcubacteria bacterium]|nr:MAG: 30S ribosomal protein S20 [Candidatus Parcubacteria bacterium]